MKRQKVIIDLDRDDAFHDTTVASFKLDNTYPVYGKDHERVKYVVGVLPESETQRLEGKFYIVDGGRPTFLLRMSVDNVIEEGVDLDKGFHSAEGLKRQRYEFKNN